MIERETDRERERGQRERERGQRERKREREGGTEREGRIERVEYMSMA